MSTRRTSATDPLRIDAVAVAAGRIGMTFCPGKKHLSANGIPWARQLDADIGAIARWGATTVVTLNPSDELAMLQVSELGAAVQGYGMQWHQLPIIDTDVPASSFEHAWQTIGAELRARLRGGESIVVHCTGGLGRTGTVAARLLIEFGATPEEAITSVRAARPGAIENARQEAYVRRQRPIAEAPSPAPAADA